MKLKELKTFIDMAVEFAGECNPDVEIWIGDKRAYKVGQVRQFGVVPDVTIHVGEKIYDEDERTS